MAASRKSGIGLWVVVIFAIAGAGGCGEDENHAAPSVPVTAIDRSHLTNVGTTAPLDYSDPNLWLCRPGNQPDECDVDLDATEFLADGSRRVVPHVRATNPQFDCFFVYPTVDLNGDGNMTDFSDVSRQRDPLYSQAARFTRVCTVYAPLYRQVSLRLSDTTATGDAAIALQDVTDAFRFYLEHLSNNRNFVLMGHSQGAEMLAAMMQTEVDPLPAVRARMISAVLIGGTIVVTQGQRTGDGSKPTMDYGVPLYASFKNIPTCATPGETGCLIAYSSFSSDSPPSAHAFFGRAPDGFEAACVNPATIAGNPGLYHGSYFPVALDQAFFWGSLQPIPAGVATPFLLYRDLFRGQCVHRNGFSSLEISLERSPGDQRAEPPYRSVVERVFGLHMVDYNIPLDDLIDAVNQQAAAMH